MPKPPTNERGKNRTPQQQNVSHQVTRSVSVAWTSPIPPPSELANYNNVIPNGAERIIALVENEQAHRIAYEKSGLSATINESKRGQYLGAIISVAAVAGAIYTSVIGVYWAVPVALVSVPVASMVHAMTKNRGTKIPKQ